jgi:hypothetical protein
LVTASNSADAVADSASHRLRCFRLGAGPALARSATTSTELHAPRAASAHTTANAPNAPDQSHACARVESHGSIANG